MVWTAALNTRHVSTSGSESLYKVWMTITIGRYGAHEGSGVGGGGSKVRAECSGLPQIASCCSVLSCCRLSSQAACSLGWVCAVANSAGFVQSLIQLGLCSR